MRSQHQCVHNTMRSQHHAEQFEQSSMRACFASISCVHNIMRSHHQCVHNIMRSQHHAEQFEQSSMRACFASNSCVHDINAFTIQCVHNINAFTTSMRSQHQCDSTYMRFNIMRFDIQNRSSRSQHHAFHHTEPWFASKDPLPQLSILRVKLSRLSSLSPPLPVASINAVKVRSFICHGTHLEKLNLHCLELLGTKKN